MNKRIWLTLSYILIGLIWLSGQTENREEEPEERMPRFLVDMNFLVGVPATEFRENQMDNGFGGGGTFLVRVNKQMPVYAGLGLSGMIFNQVSEDFLLIEDGISTDARFSVRNSIFMGHACMRFLPELNYSFLQPYFEGKVGFKNLYTRYVIKDLEFDEQINSEVLAGDWAFSYGGKVGVMILLKKGVDKIYLDISGSYLRGTAAEFYIRDNSVSLDWDNPLASYEGLNSTTDLFIYRIGIAAIF